MEHEPRDRARQLAADIVAMTALPARWVGAPPQKIADDVAASLFHLSKDLLHVGVRILLEPGVRIDAQRSAPGVAAAWPSDDAPALVTARNEAAIPIGALGRHGQILIVGELGAQLEHERLLAVIAANQLEAACVALDLEGDIAQAREKLAALGRLGALGQLVGGVAHEIRTPLTYAANNLFALESALRRAHGDAAVETARPHLRELEEAIDRIEAIVRQLRRFAKQELTRQLDEDMRDLVRDALRLWRATHAGAAQVKERFLPTPPALVDRGQMQQVILNLVQNAAEATGPQGTILVECREESGVALLAVEDDGPGMSPEVQATLFQAFRTTKPDGLGLGLSIVRGIVEAHHGTIHVDSAQGRGTRVEIRLPAARTAP